jgi:hypothetical protein
MSDTATKIPTGSIPVTYGSNPTHLFYAGDEFGTFAAIFADSFSEAHEEALCLMAERDGLCNHGVINPAQDVAEMEMSCDCIMSDSGPVWAIYLTLNETGVPLEHFNLAHALTRSVWSPEDIHSHSVEHTANPDR